MIGSLWLKIYGSLETGFVRVMMYDMCYMCELSSSPLNLVLGHSRLIIWHGMKCWAGIYLVQNVTITYYYRSFCNNSSIVWYTEIVDFCEFLSPTPEEKAARDTAIESVFQVIKHIWPHCQVLLSFALLPCNNFIISSILTYSCRMLSCSKVMCDYYFQVEVFGSFRTGLYLPTSDIDVSFVASLVVNFVN